MKRQSRNDGERKEIGGYSNITIRKKTAARFRSYSKKFSKSHSEVLDGMIQYFKINQLDPFGKGAKIINETIKKLERRIIKKMDRFIAIIKNMEKTSIRPTYEMVLILYGAYAQEMGKLGHQDVIQEEKHDFLEPRNSVPREEHDTMLKEFENYKKRCHKILNSVEKVEPMMGKPYFKIQMGTDDFESLKHQLR